MNDDLIPVGSGSGFWRCAAGAAFGLALVGIWAYTKSFWWALLALVVAVVSGWLTRALSAPD